MFKPHFKDNHSNFESVSFFFLFLHKHPLGEAVHEEVCSGSQLIKALTKRMDHLKLRKSTTLKILNIRTPKIFAVITLKFEQDGFTKE